jgi:hypothetical protein
VSTPSPQVRAYVKKLRVAITAMIKFGMVPDAEKPALEELVRELPEELNETNHQKAAYHHSSPPVKGKDK